VGRDVFRIDAGVAIPEVNEELNLGIPEGDYQTVAGFILDLLGRIPKVGDVAEYKDLRLKIEVMDGVKIEQVELRRVRDESSEDQQ
jgi:putative hemolysin